MEEKKAYDFKELLKELKDQGTPLAEDAAKLVIEALFSWAEESADLSENKIDDILKPFYPMAKGIILSAADKIDGEVG